MAEAFLNELLFQEGGCYTLFGDKPITSMLIFRGQSEDSFIKDLSPEALNTLTFVDYQTAENLRAWKQISRALKFRNFLFVEIPTAEDPTSSFLFFINIAETQKVFKKHLNKLPWASTLEKLKTADPIFWHNLFKDHRISGLLYGYGEENIEAFCSNDKKNKTFSVSHTQLITKDNFPIPTYAVSDIDTMSKKYNEQRAKIQEIYKGKNVLEVTLEALQR